MKETIKINLDDSAYKNISTKIADSYGDDMENYCPLCRKKADVSTSLRDDRYKSISCNNCGNFETHESVLLDINDRTGKSAFQRCNVVFEFLLKSPYYEIAHFKRNYAFYYEHEEEKLLKNLGLTKETNPTVINVADLMKNYPKNVSEKLDRILLNLSRKYPNIGDKIFASDLPRCLLFVEIDTKRTDTEKKTWMGYLEKAEFFNKEECILTAKAWERIDELLKNQVYNKEVFVAMSFHKSTQPLREAIRGGIETAGYSAAFMDEKIHARQIMPEMFRLIKESRFLIMDITDPNYGAYFEAGFALGLGKEIIITCNF